MSANNEPEAKIVQEINLFDSKNSLSNVRLKKRMEPAVGSNVENQRYSNGSIKNVNISSEGNVQVEEMEDQQYRSRSKGKKLNKQKLNRRLQSRNKNSKSRSPQHPPFEISLNPNNISIGGAYSQLIDPSLKSKVLRNAQNIYLKEIFQSQQSSTQHAKQIKTPRDHNKRVKQTYNVNISLDARSMKKELTINQHSEYQGNSTMLPQIVRNSSRSQLELSNDESHDTLQVISSEKHLKFPLSPSQQFIGSQDSRSLPSLQGQINLMQRGNRNRLAQQYSTQQDSLNDSVQLGEPEPEDTVSNTHRESAALVIDQSGRSLDVSQLAYAYQASLSSARLPRQNSLQYSKGESSNNKDYKQYLNQLTLNKVGKVMRDRDLEIHEMHNRIKKLLLEEQRTMRKIDDTRRRASIMNEVEKDETSRKRALRESKRDFFKDQIKASIAEIKYNREVSPKEAAAKVFEKKQKIVQDIKKAQKVHEKQINQQRFDDFHQKLVMRSKIQREIEEAQINVERQREQKHQELLREKDLEAKMKRKEVKRRDQALKKLDQMETQLLIKLNLQVQTHRDITDDYLKRRSQLHSQNRDQHRRGSQSREGGSPIMSAEGVILNVIDEEDGSALDFKNGTSSKKKTQRDLSSAEKGF